MQSGDIKILGAPTPISPPTIRHSKHWRGSCRGFSRCVFLGVHRKSAMSDSNIWLKRSQTAHLSDASQHIALACGRPPHWSEYTPWIRLSTGSLTIELTPPEALKATLLPRGNCFPPSNTSLLTRLPTFEIIGSISLVDYHYLCSWHLEYESSLEIALSANLKVIDAGWSMRDPNIQDCWNFIMYDEGTSILENGWIRLASRRNIAVRYAPVMTAPRVGSHKPATFLTPSISSQTSKIMS
ncbi:hypothetical protein K438DRAFT_882111 [Mycena galopus ATCC 62051]|nr:hypothetical protein K438DRAFT_882111 [Mycena galopus ATCC 62051]